MTKKCTKCREVKPRSEFYDRADAKDGKTPACTVCVKKAAKESALRNKDRVKARMKQYYLDNAEQAKEAARAKYYENVEANREYSLRYRREHKKEVAEKDSVRHREHYWQNRDAMLARNKAWYEANLDSANRKDHARRARLRGSFGKLSANIRSVLFEQQKGRCFCCGEPLVHGETHLDHWIPLFLGGTNTDDNIRLLTKTCNLRKGRLHPDVYTKRRDGELI